MLPTPARVVPPNPPARRGDESITRGHQVRACTKDCITVHRFVTGGEFFEEHVTILIAQERYKVVLDYLILSLSGIHSTRFPNSAPHKRPGAKTTGKGGGQTPGMRLTGN